MPCTTDVEGSKTEDLCDPRLGKSIKTSQIKHCRKSCCKSIVILQNYAFFFKPGAPNGCKEEEETMLFEVI